jgi:hypothetical protein
MLSTVLAWLSSRARHLHRALSRCSSGVEARRWFMIMEAKQTRVNDLWAGTLKIFNCVRRPARPLRLTSTAASSTLKYSSPVIELGPSGGPGLTTNPAPGHVPSLQPAGPTPAVLQELVNIEIRHEAKCVSRSAGPGSSSCLMSTCRSARPTRSG